MNLSRFIKIIKKIEKMISALSMANVNRLISYRLHVILKNNIFADMNQMKKQILIGREIKEIL